MSTCWLLVTIRTSSHRLSFERGRRFDDLDRVADVRLVVLVVHVAHRPAAHELAVLRVPHQARDLHAARLGHLVAGDDADDLSSWA